MKKLNQAKQKYDNIVIPEELSERVMTEIRRADAKQAAQESTNKRLVFRRWASAAAVFLAGFFVLLLNTSQVFAQELGEMPLIGGLAKVLTFREYEVRTEDYVIKVEIPSIELISSDFQELEADINAEILALCEQYAETAKADAEIYRQAFLETGGTLEEWLAHDITIKVWYEVELQTERYLSLAVKGSENWNSAGSETRLYHIDLLTGELVDFETVMGETYYEDNFAVPAEAAAAFGEQILEAVAQKNPEKLADLTGFPVYVGLEEGIIAETREDFLALGADRLFTEELINSVAAADLTQLTPSMAGFFLSDETGRPNIIYSVQDGTLKISGINY